MARSTSSFISAWCKPIPGITDPLVAEATAVREGVVVAFVDLREYRLRLTV